MDNRIMDVIGRIKIIGKKGRNLPELIYRTAKLAEEAGECNGAQISVDKKSYKGLTYMDVLEEALDTFIVSVDISVTDFPEFKDKSEQEINDYIIDMLNIKLDKWEKTLSEE